MLVKPPTAVMVAVGLAATEVGLVEVHTTLPPVLGFGAHTVPGIAVLLPLAMLIQVITVLTVWFEGFGVAVQAGAEGAPVWVKITAAFDLLPAGSVLVAVGLVEMLAPVPVQLMLVPVAGFGVQVVPGMVLVVPASTVQVMVTGVVPPALVGLAVQAGAAGGVVSMT